MHEAKVLNHIYRCWSYRDAGRLKLLNYHIEKLLIIDNEKYIRHWQQYSIVIIMINSLVPDVLTYKQALELIEQVDTILGIYE